MFRSPKNKNNNKKKKHAHNKARWKAGTRWNDGLRKETDEENKIEKIGDAGTRERSLVRGRKGRGRTERRFYPHARSGREVSECDCSWIACQNSAATATPVHQCMRAQGSAYAQEAFLQLLILYFHKCEQKRRNKNNDGSVNAAF